MWVPGSITFVIVIFAYVHRWLMPPEPGATRARRLASEPRRVHAKHAVPIASSFLTGSILTLVLPLGVLILVAIWYVVLWRRGSGER